MQGYKEYQEKLFVSFQLSDRVPKDNFYRCLKQELDLSFLRKQTKAYYGSEGQKSIDSARRSVFRYVVAKSKRPRLHSQERVKY